MKFKMGNIIIANTDHYHITRLGTKWKVLDPKNEINYVKKGQILIQSLTDIKDEYVVEEKYFINSNSLVIRERLAIK